MIAAIVAGLGAVVYLAVSLGVPIDVRHLPTPSAKLEPVAVIAAAAISLTFAVSWRRRGTCWRPPRWAAR